MNVRELINILEKVDPELRVVGDGYEGGIIDIDEVEHMDIVLDVHKEWYYGPHERAEGTHYKIKDDSKKVKAIHIS